MKEQYTAPSVEVVEICDIITTSPNGTISPEVPMGTDVDTEAELDDHATE